MQGPAILQSGGLGERPFRLGLGCSPGPCLKKRLFGNAEARQRATARQAGRSSLPLLAERTDVTLSKDYDNSHARPSFLTAVALDFFGFSSTMGSSGSSFLTMAVALRLGGMARTTSRRSIKRMQVNAYGFVL